MTGDADLAPWVRECCAKFALEHVGLQRLLRDATPHRGARRKWRRISALHALVYARPDSIHALLRAALADADADVASAAASVLLRIGDERAAEILIGGLRSARLPASRIAARLARFTIPIDEMLRPLLTSPRAEARYWAVTLLRNQHDHRGLAAEIVPLVDDADASVRKSALLTLAAMQSPEIGRLATWRLTDPVPYVRSAAINALAQTGERTPDRARRQAIAAGIAAALADLERAPHAVESSARGTDPAADADQRTGERAGPGRHASCSGSTRHAVTARTARTSSGFRVRTRPSP
jgi:hypothetical protein